MTGELLTTICRSCWEIFATSPKWMQHAKSYDPARLAGVPNAIGCLVATVAPAAQQPATA